MFTRRHPFLFFFLMFTGMVALTMIIISLVFVIGVGGAGLAELPPVRGERVGVVEITGVIAESKEMLRQIKSFREEDSIKAIVVRIESPGGGVGPSQEIFREIRKTVPDKTVIASMGAVAASGGYYIAAGTDGIMANPGTITGSIGVIIGYTNFEALFQKIGLAPVVIKSGPYKDMASPVRQMSEKEKKILQDFVDKTRYQFVSDVAEGRQRPIAEIETLADGRIFTGQEAKENGLVDRLGNLEDAIAWAGELGGIKGEVIAVYAQRRPPSLLYYLTDSLLQIVSQYVADPTVQADFIFRPEAAGR